MKIDRLIGIVIYLLNRDIVNCSTLAERFEVSSRTIQRDIDTLNLAGIPIVSIHGVNGGYGIIDGFKLHKQITNREDYQLIITALRGLSSGYENKKLEDIIEGIVYATKNDNKAESKIRLDIGVAREGNYINNNIKVIETATEEEKLIEFEYINSYGNKTNRIVESVGLIYKWYGWYILGFCHNKKEYRLFKVARIRNLKKLEESFTIKHHELEQLIEYQEMNDSQQYINVKLLCKENIRLSMEEYFPKGWISSEDDGNFIFEFVVPFNEIGWKGLLFTYGNQVKIIEPAELREEFIQKAEDIIETYI